MFVFVAQPERVASHAVKLTRHSGVKLKIADRVTF